MAVLILILIGCAIFGLSKIELVRSIFLRLFDLVLWLLSAGLFSVLGSLLFIVVLTANSDALREGYEALCNFMGFGSLALVDPIPWVHTLGILLIVLSLVFGTGYDEQSPIHWAIERYTLFHEQKQDLELRFHRLRMKKALPYKWSRVGIVVQVAFHWAIRFPFVTSIQLSGWIILTSYGISIFLLQQKTILEGVLALVILYVFVHIIPKYVYEMTNWDYTGHASLYRHHQDIITNLNSQDQENKG